MTKLIKNAKKKNKAARKVTTDFELRDQLAMAAMRSLIAAAPGMDPALIACDAYAFADSMLAVRDRTPAAAEV